MNLVRLFVRRPVLTSVTVLIAVFVGAYSYLSLGMTLTPEVDLPLVVVSTVYETGIRELWNHFLQRFICLI
jgi:HAE1 family hydrophobic/amphiphilic exporter-1